MFPPLKPGRTFLAGDCSSQLLEILGFSPSLDISYPTVAEPGPGSLHYGHQKKVPAVNMESYSASEDAGPSFCIGHHEADRFIPVTPQVIQRVHESNVSLSLNWTLSCLTNAK